MFKRCSSLEIHLEGWNLDNALTMIPAKNANYIKYAEENNLDYLFQSTLGKFVIMASKSSHPKLFDGSLN